MGFATGFATGIQPKSADSRKGQPMGTPLNRTAAVEADEGGRRSVRGSPSQCWSAHLSSHADG
jgi:hypothetical protein